MIKVSVMYPNTPGARFNHEYYRDKHMPLVKARLGDACKYYTVDKGSLVERLMHRRHTLECATSSAIRSRRFRPDLGLTRKRSWGTSRTTLTRLR